MWKLRPEFTDSDFAPGRVRITAVTRPTASQPAQIWFADLHPEADHPWRPVGWHHTEDFAELYDLEHWPDRDRA